MYSFHFGYTLIAQQSYQNPGQLPFHLPTMNSPVLLIAKLDFKAKSEALISLTPKLQLIHTIHYLPNAQVTKYL